MSAYSLVVVVDARDLDLTFVCGNGRLAMGLASRVSRALVVVFFSFDLRWNVEKRGIATIYDVCVIGWRRSVGSGM